MKRDGFRKMSIARARTLRVNQTDAERILWRHLRNRQLLGWKFRRQRPTGSYVADFVCLEAKLIIEVDGSQHMDNRDDVIRTTDLKSRGYRVMRFWNNEVLEQIDAVLSAICEELKRKHEAVAE